MFRWKKFSAIQKARVITVIGVVLLTVFVNISADRTENYNTLNPIVYFVFVVLAAPSIGFLVFSGFKIDDNLFSLTAVEIPINAIIGLFVVTAIGWTIQAIDWGVNNAKSKSEG